MTTTPAETDRAQLQAELATLKAKANARRGQGGYAQNVKDLDARIAEIEVKLAGSA